jgi:hypothetical protein
MRRQVFASGAVISLVAALVVGGCGSSNRGPTTAPTAPTGPPAPPAPIGPYTISGVVTEYHGGPLPFVNVTAFPILGEGYNAAQTDVQGHYSFSAPAAGMVGLGIGKNGYQSAWKANPSPHDSTANFVLQRRVKLDFSLASAFSGTIHGDEFMAGDDVLFGGLCVHTACKVIEFPNFHGSYQVEVRLRWNDPTRQLAVYKYRGDPDVLFSSPPADRYCCSSELVATVLVSGYYDAMAIAFEQAGGGPPGPADAQQFELTVRPLR